MAFSNRNKLAYTQFWMFNVEDYLYEGYIYLNEALLQMNNNNVYISCIKKNDEYIIY